ncbi:hypothetical protein BKA67DRAFT_539759 [Truncatella angustata]|uniref:Uncharacterized protein n=1 Tax=Truncatella angustata TaxID=152316 RepID=A0A9P8UCV2_9PEZI|nr:uncharacterized protein BKA67DRAFT_539759 [Truncatella angustata]KAH6647929.1 hypothetical protein BKA67DRAFT_539759 [Truncatella angustata]
MTGKVLFGILSADEPHFRSLCEAALTKLDKRRFVRNLSRILKIFHVKLSSEAETEAQKATAQLRHSKRGRNRINWLLQTSKTTGGSDQAIEEPDTSLEKQKFITRTPMKDSDAGSDVDSDVSLESGSYGAFSHVSSLRTCLQGTTAFLDLRRNFKFLFIPYDIRSVLESISKEEIWVSQRAGCIAGQSSESLDRG